MTAADVLTLGCREPLRGETASSTSNSESRSDTKPTASSNFQLKETIAPTTKASELFLKGGKERRIMSLKLSWVDQPSTIIDDTVTAVKEQFGSVFVLREGEHRTMFVDEKQVECVLHQELESVPASSSVMAHHAALSRLSDVNNYCSNPHVHVSWDDRKNATRLSAIDHTECPRIRDLLVKNEVLGREAIELPPTSPLYLGLSFIACATAATAANFLVRR
ncbi:unnamed protein product [Peronospora destructor]|uniref:Uncharacterized protein n=1 Tax=Peronospora destructor TaxID=86335 RepID=A0AAV0V3Y2_9STRA|nr:unnamed protein product [Peronospora destructor]